MQEIRSNQQQELDLDVMDIKIGLLVKNRITLQDVVSTSQQVKRKDKKSNRHSQILDQGAGFGVGGLSKANHEKIEVRPHPPVGHVTVYGSFVFITSHVYCLIVSM